MHATTRAAGLVAGLTMTLGALAPMGTASAVGEEPTAPCAQQQKQVDKAAAALERVTAVFERQKAKGDMAD